MLKKAAEKAEEKAADKIQAVLRRGISNSVATRTPTVEVPRTPRPKSKKTPQRALSSESRQKLKKMLSGVSATQLSGDSRKKLNQILNAGRAAKLKVNQYLAEN